MMINLIKTVSLTCPVCKTGSIVLDVTPKSIQKILKVSESFACPVCNEKFSGAHKLLESIRDYNETTTILNRYQEHFGVQLN